MGERVRRWGLEVGKVLLLPLSRLGGLSDGHHTVVSRICVEWRIGLDPDAIIVVLGVPSVRRNI